MFTINKFCANKRIYMGVLKALKSFRISTENLLLGEVVVGKKVLRT
jgi:hypothetical protein